MEKIRAHYASRIQANLDQVTKERDALRNWQNAMQSENQRITDVIELCGKQPAPKAAAAVAGAGTAAKPEASISETLRSAMSPRSGN
jgi:hypothetical protein